MKTQNQHQKTPYSDCWLSWAVIMVAMAMMPITMSAKAQTFQQLNGFDLSDVSIDLQEIASGGPPRDGIPSIDQPTFVDIAAVDYLQDDDIVISVSRNGVTRAYPTRILVWHEIVNDVLGEEAIAVTYCPLCGTGMVFASDIAGQRRSFGVSGLLYRSDVLMYDRETESLWSQLAMQAVSGAAKGAQLTWLVSEQLTWQAWRQRYPEGEVLSLDTGHHRHYAGEAYSTYFSSPKPMFAVPQWRRELPDKSWVIGIIVDGQPKAYPINTLTAETAEKSIHDVVGEQAIVVTYDAASQHATVTTKAGEAIPSVMVFWFAWQAFYPKTGLWQP